MDVSILFNKTKQFEKTYDGSVMANGWLDSLYGVWVGYSGGRTGSTFTTFAIRRWNVRLLGSSSIFLFLFFLCAFLSSTPLHDREGQHCYCYLLDGRINTDFLRADEWSG